MTASRYASFSLLALLAAAGCGESRGTNPTTTSVTIPGPDGSANGAVTVDAGLCVRCHGDAANLTDAATDSAGIQFAPPKDVAGATSGAKVGDHEGHLKAGPLRGAGVPCAACHVIPQGAMQHVPGVQFRGLASTVWSGAPISPTYDASTGTCAATYCHGNFPGGKTASVTWTSTATLGCASCHGFPPAAPHPNNSTCESCHQGYTGGGQINLTDHINGRVDGGCTGCHGDATRANGGIAGVTYDANQTAAPPVASAAYGSVVVGAHVAHVNPTPSVAGTTQPTGGIYKPIACTECHPDNTTGGTHPNNTLTVTFAAATGANLGSPAFPGATFSQGNGTTTATTCSTYCHNGASDASATNWSWTGTGATCGSCHGFPPASHSASLTTAAQCSGCHGGTVNTDGTINIAGGLHINGQLDGGGEPAAPGAACDGCHPTIYAGMTGTATSKHTLGSADPAFQTGVAWSSPLSGVAAANRTCTNMCHDDHPHDADGTTHSYNVYTDANARDAATKTTSTRSRTDFDAAATNGGLCVSCHVNPISVGGPVLTKATYAASAHTGATTSDGTNTYTWRYTLDSGSFDRDCTKCHASTPEGLAPSFTGTSVAAVHSNANPTLLAGTVSPIAAGLVCFNCHGSTASPANNAQGNRSGANIQSEFAKASNHAAVGDCLSCHDPHRAKAGDHATPGNLAGPPIEGAAGAVLDTNPAFWTAPAAGSFSATTIVAGTDLEATLCFKCHSAYAGTLPTGTTDVAKEFNPNNVGNFAGTWASGETAGGFHPVLASAGSNLGAVKLTNLVTTNHAWSTTTRNTMTCTDCHGSDNVTDPNGPHGSAANFILKGPNTSWNASIVLGSSIPAGTFCLNCHQSTFTNSRFTGHSRSDHFVACFNCHAAVPHGGPRPGMLVAGAGAAAGVGGTIAGWDTTSPYWQGTATDRLYIVSYPTTNGGNWSQGNCGCNGTNH